jgi:hypothetical protein
MKNRIIMVCTGLIVLCLSVIWSEYRNKDIRAYMERNPNAETTLYEFAGAEGDKLNTMDTITITNRGIVMKSTQDHKYQHLPIRKYKYRPRTYFGFKSYLDSISPDAHFIMRSDNGMQIVDSGFMYGRNGHFTHDVKASYDTDSIPFLYPRHDDYQMIEMEVDRDRVGDGGHAFIRVGQRSADSYYSAGTAFNTLIEAHSIHVNKLYVDEIQSRNGNSIRFNSKQTYDSEADPATWQAFVEDRMKGELVDISEKFIVFIIKSAIKLFPLFAATNDEQYLIPNDSITQKIITK